MVALPDTDVSGSAAAGRAAPASSSAASRPQDERTSSGARADAAAAPVGAGVTAAAAIGRHGARGLLAVPVAVLALALTAAAGWVLVRWLSGRAAALRRSVAQPVGVASMLLIAVTSLLRVRAADGSRPSSVSDIGSTMPYPIV